MTEHKLVVAYAAHVWTVECSGCDWKHSESASFSGVKASQIVQLFKAHSPGIVTSVPAGDDSPIFLGKLGYLTVSQ